MGAPWIFLDILENLKILKIIEKSEKVENFEKSEIFENLKIFEKSENSENFEKSENFENFENLEFSKIWDFKISTLGREIFRIEHNLGSIFGKKNRSNHYLEHSKTWKK